jgi:hypothetical protein
LYAFKLHSSKCSNFAHLKVLGTRRLRFLGGSFGTFELTSSLDKSIFELLFREEVFAHAICLRLNQSGYLKLFDRKQFGNFFTAVFQSFELGISRCLALLLDFALKRSILA